MASACGRDPVEAGEAAFIETWESLNAQKQFDLCWGSRLRKTRSEPRHGDGATRCAVPAPRRSGANHVVADSRPPNEVLYAV